MSPLRRRMIEDMTVRNLSPATQRSYVHAVATFGRVFGRSPDKLDLELGAVLRARGRRREAEHHYRAALRQKPDYPAAHSNLGAVRQELGDLGESEARLREAIRLRPDHSAARSNLSLVLLLTDRFQEGWQQCERRWADARMVRTERHFQQPRWHGEALGGRVLLLHAEQGIGDTIQFCRYARILTEQGDVILEVQAPLARLLRSLRGSARIVSQGDPLPCFDLHCPLLSVPLALGITMETIPSSVPYLSADAASVAAWRERPACLPGLKVGLVWGAVRVPTNR